MAGPTVDLTGIPTGGAVRLDLPDYLSPPSGVTFMSVSRAVSGTTGLSTWTTIYSGSPMPVYVDCGDYLPAPLSSGSTYVWRVDDDRGSTQAGPLAPVCEIESRPDGLTPLLIRLLQGGVNCMSLPEGIKRTQVTTRMPQNGYQAMPFVVVNLDLIQQQYVEVGQDVPNPNAANEWTVWSLAKRIWRVSVFAQDAQERDFYRDSMLSMLRVLSQSVFSQIGMDVADSYQAASGTDAKEWEGHTPGFYYADLMFEMTGQFDTTVLTHYDTILEIDVGVTVLRNDTTIEVPSA